MPISITPTPATVQTLRNIERANAGLQRRLTRDVNFSLSRGRQELIRQWRGELQHVTRYTTSGVQFRQAEPSSQPTGALSIIDRVYDYMRFHIFGGIRRYARGRLVYFRGVGRRERLPRNRVEVPIQGTRTRLLLGRGRRRGRGKAIGLRIFRAAYTRRASGPLFIERTMIRLLNSNVTETLERHSRTR